MGKFDCPRPADGENTQQKGEIVTATKILGLLSAVVGASGTLLLFFGSFAYEGFAPYYNKEIIDAQVKRNKRRQRLQRAGLLLLILSFVLAGLSVWFG